MPEPEFDAKSPEDDIAVMYSFNNPVTKREERTRELARISSSVNQQQSKQEKLCLNKAEGDYLRELEHQRQTNRSD